MLRSEPSKEPAIELPIMSSQNVRTAHLRHAPEDECSRNSVTVSLSQRAQQEFTESVIVIPDRPLPRC
jgi:hypothetical protein